MLNKFIPDFHVHSIYHLDFKMLKSMGIKLVMFDLDNTLISYNMTKADDKLKKFLEELAIDFELILVSNSRKTRVENFCQPLNLNFVKFAKKPLKKGFKEALSKTSREYMIDEVCEIGDQIMTDILGANRMGFTTILVDPLDRTSEHLPTKFNRFVEKIVRFFLKTCKKAKYSKYLINYQGEKNDR